MSKENNQSDRKASDNILQLANYSEAELLALTEKLAELDILRQSLAEKKQQAETYYDQLLRLKAEMENYRKRVDKQLELQYQRGRESVLIKLIDFLDILAKAQETWQADHSPDSLKSGLTMIVQELNVFVGNSGIAPIPTEDKQFDPGYHEALEQEERADLPEGQIIRQLRPGYCLNGQVIRPAQVVVAKHKEEDKING